MEYRIGTCNGAEIPRKSKSLDLKSLYKSRISMESQHTELKRKISSEGSDEEKRKKRRKSSKIVSISSLRNVDNCKNSLDEAYNRVLSSGSHDSKNLKLKLSHKRDDSGGLNVIYLSLDDSGFQIPKRKRGFVGRRKVEVSQVLKLPRQSCSKGSDDVVSKAMDGNMAARVESSKEWATRVGSPTDLGVGAESFKDSGIHVLRSKVKCKKGFDNFKEKRDSESNAARLLKEGAGHASNLVVSSGESSLKKVDRKSELNLNRYLKEGECASHSVVNNRDTLKKSNEISNSNLAWCLKEDEGCASQSVVNNGDSSLKKSGKNHDNRNDPTSDRSIAKEAKPIIDTSVKTCGDALDDEENLEENAAMMLLSRFDPNCTGFSSNEKSIASMNGFSLLSSSEQDFSGHESVPFDAAGRALRPRTRHKERGQSRKRRHYYEIFSGDLDAYWALNRRIKIFWPLDQCWYYGLVNDYDKESKLHHVKYDDRDEEWINLRNEKFKLLLLPSEVPDKGACKRSKIREKGLEQGKGSLKPSKEKGKRDMTTKDDKFMGSCMDTEPIISWLARSTNRIKSSPLHAMKKQKRPDPSLTFEPSFLSHEVVKPDVSLESAFLKANNNKLASTAKLLDSFIGGRRGEESSSGSPTCSKDSKLPIVYCRRRFRSTSSGNHVSTRTPSSITLPAPSIDGFVDLEEYDICMKMLDPDGAFQSTSNTELLNLTIPLIESRQMRFEICFPVLSVLKYAFGAENFWLLHAVFLFHYGTVTTIWPIVNLEMLFVDNIVGLRFFLFEGCLKQAVAFIFLILRVFHRPNEQGNYADRLLPVTSIRFKFSCIHKPGKQFVFAFYNFSEMKNSLWMYLDTKLKSHCQLSRQLSLSECTYDNIKALQNGSNVLSMNSSLCRDSSLTKGLWKTSRQGVSREFTCVKVSQFSFPDRNQRKFPPFALSFAAAPSFFLSLHLKLLMEHRADHISFRGHDSVEQPECAATLMMDNRSSFEYCLDKHPETTYEHNASKSTLENNVKGTTRNAVSDGYVSVAKPELPTVSPSACVDGRLVRSPQKYENGDLNGAGTFGSSQDCEETGGQAIDRLQRWQCHSSKLECVRLARPSVDGDKTDAGSLSPLNGIRVEIPTFNQFERHVDREFHSAQRPTDLIWNMNGGIIPSPNPTGPRSTWNRNRNSFSSFAYFNQGWSDGKDDIGHNNFGYGPRKPRTQVPYSFPFGGFDYGLRNRVHNQKVLPYTRIRRANEKRLSDATRDSQKNLELLCCDANVLITHSDKGWRECGAQIVLELSDHNEWKLAVKLSGTTRYLYKAHQFLQPGSTNRFTHAMMWKGGKDWTLEFPDRSQWFLFKDMHEECYNRNIRAASVKNIPIPVVHLIEDCDDNETEVAFVRSSSKYFQQVETDVEMALNPSRVLYDMDSDDEQWIMKMRNSCESVIAGLWEISEEMFEKTMDIFEKAAYSQQRDQFTQDEIEEFMAGVGPMDTIKIIYEHWREKRLQKGIPLIRHLQPPSWERYQQQVKEWEVAMSISNYVIPNGCQGKAAPIEKPLMFAFCLKPRGLEVVANRGSKHRSHRKISISGHSNLAMGDHVGFHNFGRRFNGFAFGDEKVVYTGLNHEYLDDCPLSQTSPRVFTPRVYSPHDAGSISCFSMSRYGFDKHQYQKLQRSKSKKVGAFEYLYDTPMASPYNQQMMGKRNGIYRWNMGYSEWSSQRHLHPDGSQRHGPGKLDGSDLDEFRLRDASGAAQHACNMAKLKREKAQRLLYRADLAISKAVNALMIAEAIKVSFDDVNSDG